MFFSPSRFSASAFGEVAGLRFKNAEITRSKLHRADKTMPLGIRLARQISAIRAIDFSTKFYFEFFSDKSSQIDPLIREGQLIPNW